MQPIYSEIKGWQEDLTAMTSVGELPDELMAYIKYIEDFVDVPVKIVSVGPDRKQTILR